MSASTEFLSISLTDWVGYAASAAVLSSFLMKEITKLRLVNMVGCVLFVIYGTMLNMALPIIIPNTAIFFIQIYYLWKGKNSKLSD